MTAQRLAVTLLLSLTLLLPRSAVALVEYHSDDNAFSLRLSGYLKTLALGLTPSLPGTEDGAEDFSRARLMLDGTLGAYVSWSVHYEHFAVVNPLKETTAGLFTGSSATNRQRLSLLPLDWTIKDTGSLFWQHELDRLNVRFSFPAADIVVGRQAISWGVGRFWNPSDIFIGFSPVQIDREYKTGVDAVTMKVPLGSATQLETVYAAFGEDFRDQSTGARVRTTVRKFDLGMMAAKSFTDFVTGPFFDGEIRGAGIRGEFTFTHNTTEPHPKEPRTFFRAVSSADYRFANSLYMLFEYYYNGFGTTDPGEYTARAKSERRTRGEIFNVGRHYIGSSLEYELHPLVNVALSTQWNLLDQSVLLGPLLNISLSDEADLQTGAYFPFGTGLVGQHVKSEYGLYPKVYYLQLRLYF
ncbi:MAG TPA: hypothetical protein VKJ47_06505 [Candidatus Binatia bacterium]|nr:hypothetical protein [Candidatus Binatia bacterium]